VSIYIFPLSGGRTCDNLSPSSSIQCHILIHFQQLQILFRYIFPSFPWSSYTFLFHDTTISSTNVCNVLSFSILKLRPLAGFLTQAQAAYDVTQYPNDNATVLVPGDMCISKLIGQAVRHKMTSMCLRENEQRNNKQSLNYSRPKSGERTISR